MRTTLVLDDDLLRQAKIRAAHRRVSVSDIVNQALRATLTEADPDASPFRMLTYGRDESPMDHDPSDFAAALDDEDRSRVG